MLLKQLQQWLVHIYFDDYSHGHELHMWSCYLLVMPVQATVKKIVICVSLKAFFWNGFHFSCFVFWTWRMHQTVNVKGAVYLSFCLEFCWAAKQNSEASRSKFGASSPKSSSLSILGSDGSRIEEEDSGSCMSRSGSSRGRSQIPACWFGKG